MHRKEKRRDVRENSCVWRLGVECGRMKNVVRGVGGGGGMEREGKVMSVKAEEKGRKKMFRKSVGEGGVRGLIDGISVQKRKEKKERKKEREEKQTNKETKKRIKMEINKKWKKIKTKF